MAQRISSALSLAIAAAVASLGGYVADLLGVPLAWLVGAMLTTAAMSISGVTIRMPKAFYRAGQVTIAVAVGLTVSADVAQVLAPHVPFIFLGAALSVAIGRILAEPLSRFGGMSLGTAHFAMIPAGISEMGELSGKRGADVGAVATFHTVRVMLVVLIMPAMVLFVFGPVERPTTRGVIIAYYDMILLIALACGAASAFLASRAGLPAAWFIAPMAVVAVLSGVGALSGQMPGQPLAVAQVALGLALGARFKRTTILRLPRALAVGVPLMLVHALLMATAATLIAQSLGLDLTSVILGLSTGGTAEMVLTAKLVGANAALVAAYQITRGLLGNLLADLIFRKTVASRRPEKDD